MKNFLIVSKRLTTIVLPLLLFSTLTSCTLDGKSILGGVPEDTSLQVPTVTVTIPEDQAEDIPLNQQLTATFSLPMNSSSITTAGTFTLVETISEDSVSGLVTYDAANQIVTFVPDVIFSAMTEYTATISVVAESSNGQPIASSFSWSFESGLMEDLEAPLLLSTDPQELEIDVSVDRSINAVFDEPMNAALIDDTTFTVTCELPCISPPSGDVSYTGNTATFVVPNGEYLESDTVYTATIAAEDLAGNPWVFGDVPNPWTFTTAVHLGPQTVVLGATEPYGILSNIGVTLGDPGSLLIDGDVGIYPDGGGTGACVNCNSVTVSGVIENGTVPAQDAIVALQVAYDDAIGRVIDQCTLIDSGVLDTNPSLACGGDADGVFPPGLYWSGSSIAIPAGGTITLDGKGDPTSVFIFQSESTISTIGGNTNIILINGAKAENIFWVAKSSATIGGTTSSFEGTVIALVAVTVNTGTTMNGRALARGAEVTVQSGALVIVPGQ